MPRTRLTAAALIVGLLAVGCGGDDTDDRGDALSVSETGTAARAAPAWKCRIVAKVRVNLRSLGRVCLRG